MKRLLMMGLFICLLCGCVSYSDPIVDSLPEEGQGTVYTCGYFQDYTDYGVYQFAGITPEILDRNEYFQIVTAENIPLIHGYIENFEGWIELEQDCDDCQLAEQYSFSIHAVQAGDYFHISNGHSEHPYYDYDLYYFSMSTQTLYYFHSNI